MSDKLTPRQEKIFTNLMAGMSVYDAVADTCDRRISRQAASQAVRSIRAKLVFDLESNGLTNQALIERYLKPALEAKVKKYATYRGVIMDEREDVDWSARLQALDITFKLKGSYRPTREADDDSEDDDRTLQVNIQVIGGNVTVAT